LSTASNINFHIANCFISSTSTGSFQNNARDAEAGEKLREDPVPAVRNVLDAIGLSIVYNLLGKIFGWHLQEQRKTVMDKKRTLAAIRCLIHIIPAAACLVLFRLNLKNWYLGQELQGPEGHDTEKLGALQFVAKVHELFMLSSLGVILITHLRKELAFGDGIPFGALFSSNQFQSINILWSLEFWGAIYYQWPRKTKKGFIITLILLCSILGLSVGPSTANLMKPRLDYWPAGGTPFWVNASNDTLFPAKISNAPGQSHCAVDSGDLACPYGEWETLNDELFDQSSYTTGTFSAPHVLNLQTSVSTRSMQLRSRSQYPQAVFQNPHTSATVPYSFVADSIVQLAQLWTQAVETVPGTLLYRLENGYTVNVYQPVVISRCVSYSANARSRPQFGFPVMNSTTLNYAGDQSDPGPTVASYPYVVDYSDVDDRLGVAIDSALNTTPIPALYWIDDPELLSSTHSSLSVLAVVPKIGNFEPSYFCCSTEIPFLNTSVTSGQFTSQTVTGAPARWLEYRMYTSNVPRMSVDSAWADYLNPAINDTASAFSIMAQSASRWNLSAVSMAEYPEISIETILSTLLASGISRNNLNASVLLDGYLKSTPQGRPDWINNILPKNQNYGTGSNAFEVPQTIQAQSTKLQFNVENFGYCYSSSGIVQKAALVVLMLYVVFVFLHCMESVWTGFSTSSWGSPSEIAALALNSTPSERLHNIGAGINTVSVYEHRVQLGEKGQILELTIKERDMANKLKANEAYG
jgi:hypothetical protein